MEDTAASTVARPSKICLKIEETGDGRWKTLLPALLPVMARFV